MPRSCASIRCCDLGLHTPGRAQGGPLEEPAAVILHGGIREGGVLAEPWWTYTGTKLETVDTAKENLQLTGTPLLGTSPMAGLTQDSVYSSSILLDNCFL